MVRLKIVTSFYYTSFEQLVSEKIKSERKQMIIIKNTQIKIIVFVLPIFLIICTVIFVSYKINNSTSKLLVYINVFFLKLNIFCKVVYC